VRCGGVGPVGKNRGFRALQSAGNENRGFHGDKGDLFDCMIRAVDMVFLSQTG
jgi:hypothetical protein